MKTVTVVLFRSGLGSISDYQALIVDIGLSLDPCLTRSSGPMVEMAPGALRGPLGVCQSAFWDQSLGPP